MNNCNCEFDSKLRKNQSINLKVKKLEKKPIKKALNIIQKDQKCYSLLKNNLQIKLRFVQYGNLFVSFNAQVMLSRRQGALKAINTADIKIYSLLKKICLLTKKDKTISKDNNIDLQTVNKINK